jgi:hypothetical protein
VVQSDFHAGAMAPVTPLISFTHLEKGPCNWAELAKDLVHLRAPVCRLSLRGLLSQVWLVKPERKRSFWGHRRAWEDNIKCILKAGNVKVLAGFNLLRIVPPSEHYFYKTSEICY